MKHIYKYVSMETALEIIRTGMVILNNPVRFNDPFDSQIVITKNAENKVFKLVENYFFLKIFKDILEKNELKLNPTQNVLINFLRFELSVFDCCVRKNKKYIPIPILNLYPKMFSLINSDFKDAKDAAEEKVKNETIPQIMALRNKTRIGCFSKKSNSVLMWSHYADSHHGICLEFDEERSFFKDVNYAKSKPRLDLYSAVSRILAFDYVGEVISYNDYKFAKKMLEPFFTKSSEWSYEEEVRCVLSDNEPNTEGYQWDGERSFINMKITKVLVGTKADGEALNKILKAAEKRSIPVVFMKESKDRYAIVPDLNRVQKAEDRFIPKANSVDILFDEMNRALKASCFISALSIALTIPGVLGQIVYPDLPYQEAYEKWYQDVIGQYEKNPKESEYPYPSGELCFKLKEAIQNYGHSSINGKYSDFEITELRLKAERENTFGIYINNSSIVIHEDGSKEAICDISIRNLCQKIETSSQKTVEEHKKEVESLPIVQLSDFEKDVNEIMECCPSSETLTKMIDEAAKKKLGR